MGMRVVVTNRKQQMDDREQGGRRWCMKPYNPFPCSTTRFYVEAFSKFVISRSFWVSHPTFSVSTTSCTLFVFYGLAYLRSALWSLCRRFSLSAYGVTLFHQFPLYVSGFPHRSLISSFESNLFREYLARNFRFSHGRVRYQHEFEQIILAWLFILLSPHHTISNPDSLKCPTILWVSVISSQFCDFKSA